MALIFVNRNREMLGKFTDQEVFDGLKTGRFLPSDLGWKDPMPSWETLDNFGDLFTDLGVESEMPLPETACPPLVEPAWERSISLSGGLTTVMQIYGSPSATFKNLPVNGKIRRSFLYYLIFSLIGYLFAVFYNYIFSIINQDSFLDRFVGFPLIHAEVQRLIIAVGVKEAINVIFFSSLVMQPFILTGCIFVISLVTHFFLKLSGAAEKCYNITFKALGYSLGTGFLLQIIPLFGVPLSWVACLALSVFALKESHCTNLWRVMLAGLLMTILGCVLLVLFSASIYLLAFGFIPKS